jgi:hypothetical protein
LASGRLWRQLLDLYIVHGATDGLMPDRAVVATLHHVG